MNEITAQTVTCPLSRWYYGRAALLIALSAGLGLYFLFDGAVGYPNKNRSVDLYEAFDAEKRGQDWQPQTDAEGSIAADHLAEIEKARQAGRDGVSWAGFAADRRLPEKAPERFTAEQIHQQYHIAIALGVFALLGGLFLLLVRGRTLRCDADSLTLPSGRRIPFSQVVSIDLRKWHKGFGRLTYRDENHRAQASEVNDGRGAQRVRIDDYKYAGSAEILRRVCQQNPDVTIEGDRRWLWPEDQTATSAAD